jgi:hypothetical protein
MDSAGSSNTIIKKQEDEEKNDKRDIKPVPKTLNRVPRKLLKNLSLEFALSLNLTISQGACVSKMALSAIFSDSQVYPHHQNACRKQKMRCEGADNPPCKRCRNAGLDCLFEKPSREATLTGEAGLE